MRIRSKQRIDWYIGYGLTGILLPITRLLGILLRRNHSLSKPPRRILFIKLLGLGSLIVASEAIMAMRRQWPDTRFILLTDSNIGEGIAPFGVFDEIIATDTNRLGKAAFAVARLFARCWTWRNLWVVDLEIYSKLTTVVSLLTLARNRWGFYLPPVPLRKFLNTHNIPFDSSTFLVNNYFAMASAVAGVSLLPSPTVVSAGEQEKPFILLNNTCSSLSLERKLPDTVFAAVCNWLLENTDYRLALLGAPEDKAPINNFIQAEPGLQSRRQRILNYAGLARDFDEYYSFIRGSGACLITIDSGPLHIARKLGLPTLSIWGPTDPSHYLHILPAERRRHLFVYLAKPCAPCVHHSPSPPCGGNNICMKDIPVSAITGKIEMLLSQCKKADPPIAVR